MIRKGNTYEIRRISNGDDTKVQIFDQRTGIPFSPPYGIDFESAQDAYRCGIDPVKELAEIAHDDFLRWDNDLKFAFSD